MSEAPPVTEPARSLGRFLGRGLVTSVVQQGVGLVVSLASVPLALHHLGVEDYGAWATAVALTTVFVFADLGVGVGLMTRLGTAGEARYGPAGRQLVSSAYGVLAAVVACALVVLAVAAASGALDRLVGGSERGQAGLIVAATCAGFLVNMVVSLIVRVQYAVGQQAASNLWQAAGGLVVLAAMWAAATFTTEPWWFAAAAAFAPVGMGMVNAAVFFCTSPQGRPMRPVLSAWDRATSISLMRLGSRFLVVSLLLAGATAIDPLIVARTAGLDDVAAYTVPARVFAIVSLVGVTALMPLWPLHARAIREGRVDWIRRITVRVGAASALAMSVIAAALLLVISPLFEVWLDGKVPVDLVLCGGLAAWCVATAVTGPLFMVQNGAEVLGPQVWGYGLLLMTLPLKWWAATVWGSAAVPWVGVAGYVVFVVPACVVGYRRSLRLAGGRAVREGNRG